MLRNRLAPWRIPALMILFSLVPFAASVNRLIWLNTPDAAPDPAADRFADEPLTLVLHILFGSVFLVLASAQFSAEFRTRRPVWHRTSGRVAGLAGLVAAVTGIWLIVGFPAGPLATATGDAIRVFFAGSLAGAIIRAITAARSRDFARHRAWMIRAFAIAVAGSTQAVLIGTWVGLTGAPTPEAITVLLALGFVFNAAIAEARIRTVSPTASPLRPQRKIQ